MDEKHGLLAKKPYEEMNSLVRIQVERQLVKKRQNVSSFENFEISFVELPYKKDGMKIFFWRSSLADC